MTYHFIVVGAGSAGAVMASRLSERPDRTVLLLEAGPDHDSAGTPPGIAGADLFAALETPGRVWPRLTATRTTVQAAAFYARGRGAGGSSAANALGAIRGLPGDYDGWAQNGCDRWAWDDVAATFDAVDVMIPNAALPAQEWGAMGRALHDAAIDVGHPFVPDHHLPAAGVSPFRLTLRDGRRVSTNDAYLEAARARRNLTIRGDTLVDRVVVEGGRTTGVVVAGEHVKGQSVVLSAGAIHSPAILLRSGLDRPGVGANLMDHARVSAMVSLHEPAPPDRPAFTVIVRYSSGLGDDLDMQLIASDHLGTDTNGLRLGMVSACLMAPRSTGRVLLRSSDPTVDPVVELNFLSDELDMERMTAGVRHLRQIMDHPAMTSIGDFAGLSGRGTFAVLESETTLRDWLRASVEDYVHACGTCRMGSEDDRMAVVDSSCRYIGVAGLHVVDASVMPSIPRANTHLSTVMIAEKVATTMTAPSP